MTNNSLITRKISRLHFAIYDFNNPQDTQTHENQKHHSRRDETELLKLRAPKPYYLSLLLKFSLFKYLFLITYFRNCSRRANNIST